MDALGRILDRKRYAELRRRMARCAMQPITHASDARTPRAGDIIAADIHRILICRPNHRLGNLVLLTPLVSEVERIFPRADVDILLAGEHVAELFQGFPTVKHIYSLSRRRVLHPLALARTVRQLRGAHYDLAVDPCEASQTGRFLVVAANPKRLIGICRRESACKSLDRSMEPAPLHMAKWPVYLVRRAALPRNVAADPDFPLLDIRLSIAERQRGQKLLGQLFQDAGAPGAGAIASVFAEAHGAKKCSSDWWQRFLGALQAWYPGLALVEIAPPDGRPRLASKLPFFSSPSPREVAAVIANTTCFISADCGVMHLASAAGTPTIGLFSTTSAARYEPYGHGSTALGIDGRSAEECGRAAATLARRFLANAAPERLFR